MLNKKGVFITFMAFLLIGAVLAISVATKQVGIKKEQNLIEESAFRELNQQFNSIYGQVHEKKQGQTYDTEVQQRILPGGKSTTTGDSLLVSQQVPQPALPNTATDMYDAMNLFSIFISDPRINPDYHVNAGVTDALNPEEWGGGAQTAEAAFMVQPFCIKYLPLQSGSRMMGFEVPGEAWEAWGCKQAFDITKIKSVEINFYAGACTGEEYINGTACDGSFDSGGQCSTTLPASAPACLANACPPVTINIIENCASCHWSGCKGTIMGYLDISKYATNRVTLQLANGTMPYFGFLGTSPGRAYLFQFDGQGITLANNADVKITFDSPPVLGASALDIAIKKEGFEYCRSTSEGGCPD